VRERFRLGLLIRLLIRLLRRIGERGGSGTPAHSRQNTGLRGLSKLVESHGQALATRMSAQQMRELVDHHVQAEPLRIGPAYRDPRPVTVEENEARDRVPFLLVQHLDLDVQPQQGGRSFQDALHTRAALDLQLFEESIHSTSTTHDSLTPRKARPPFGRTTLTVKRRR